MKSTIGKEINVAENHKPKSSPNPIPDDVAQSHRFIEDAKSLEVDGTGKVFERAIGVVPLKTRPNTKRSGAS